MKSNPQQQPQTALARTKTEYPVKRFGAYEEFILWTAMPDEERDKLGIETQGEFCEKYHIDKNTPTRWKARADFISQVTELRRQWAFDRTGNVIKGIYLSALKGNPFSQKLWLQYFLGFKEQSEVAVTDKVEIGVNDIRFLIEALPEPLKSKHYANLRQLLDDAADFADARNIDPAAIDDETEGDGGGGSERPAEAVRGDANPNAPHISVRRTDGVAASHQASIRADMGADPDRAARPSARHNESAARWGQE
jgi:hypothetical protein